MAAPILRENLSSSTPVSLEEMLYAREHRAQKQALLNGRFRQTLISFTMNIPGAHKTSTSICDSFDWGCKELFKLLKTKGIAVLYDEFHYPSTGPEGYFVIDEESAKVKALTVTIEENHPLGRLFDFDVMSPERQCISRIDLGLHERKCFICNDNAKACGRGRKHTAMQLHTQIDEIIKKYNDCEGFRLC
jgi:holo-ACP synthase